MNDKTQKGREMENETENKTENETENAESTIDPERRKKIIHKIDPFLEHLNVEGVEIDKDKIREHFVKLWEYENGDSLEGEEKYLTTIGVTIYATHIALDDYNINVKRSREHIKEAFRALLAPEFEKMAAEEKATDNPFKTFVEKNVPRVDDVYTWRYFFLDHKKQDEKEWSYKMGKCWFATFFIRFGRTDYIQTACEFDKLPSEAREDYVDLKLQNGFSKLGQFCKFSYTPKESS